RRAALACWGSWRIDRSPPSCPLIAGPADPGPDPWRHLRRCRVPVARGVTCVPKLGVSCSMMLWLILALMTAAALGAAVWPLVRARGTPAGGSDLAVYRDQLEEIERDRTDARIGADEAEAARVEVSRRLLAAAHAESARPADSTRSARRRYAAV